MAKVECVPVEDWHVEFIAAAMRQADRDEVRLLGGFTPREALDASLANPGRHWTGLIGGAPVAIFGVVPLTLIGSTGIVWLLGTNAIAHYPRIFARMSRTLVDEFLDHYTGLVNVLHADNRVALRWLEWLGATFRRNGDLIYFELKRRS